MRFSDSSLGLGSMLGILIDHWEQNPPSYEWMKETLALYPKRGRPRRSESASMEPRVALRLHDRKGHDLFTKKNKGGSAYKVYYCKHCTLFWSTHDSDQPPSHCPRKYGFSTFYSQKVWKKSELLALGFEKDEVAWAQNDQDQEERSSGSPE